MKQHLLKPLFLLLLSGFFSTILYAQTQKYHRIQATISNEKFQSLMRAGLGIDHYEYKNGVLSAEVSDADISLLKRKNIAIKYLIRDIAKNLDAYNARIDREAADAPITNLVTIPTPVNFGTGGTYGTAGGVTKHFTFQEMQNELDQMKQLYPNLITAKTSVGTTGEGRMLFMVKISDNPNVDENEPEVFLNAVHHAREPIGMTQLLFFMWHILENYESNKEIRTLLNSSEIYIMPCLNPDGYVYNATNNPTGGGMWRKNRRNNGSSFGVDNNRNYSYRWGGNGSSGTTTSDTYRGTAPFSELENQAVRDFCKSRQFVTEFNYHSYGNYCIYPYSAVAVNDNPEVPLFNQLAAFLTEDNGFVYGNCQQTLNYIADGEAADWGYGEQSTKGKMYGFTPEVGNSSDGFYPAASRILPLCNSMVVMNMNLLKVSTKYGLVTSSAPASVFGSSATIPFSLKNFSIYPASYNVTLSSTSTYVTIPDATKNISSSTIFQTINNQFAITLDPVTPIGTILDFVISTNNGFDTRTDNFTIQYICAAPIGTTTSGITTTAANISWAAIDGVTDYFVSSKLASSTNWDPETSITGSNNTSLSGLTPGTAYNWKVRTGTCTNYSATQNFTTGSVCNTPVPVASVISSTGFTLTWPVISGAASYTVQTRLQGAANWISSNVTTNSKQVTALTPNSVYELQVRTNCSFGTSLFSAVQTVTTLSYCLANGTNNTNEWIDYIQLGTINRASGIEPGGYINTGLSTNLARNKSYPLTFSAGFSLLAYKEFWDVFIDYNNDGDFADNGEHELSVNKTGTGNYTANFSVPGNSPLTTTRMRIKMSRINSDDPCAVIANGEVEDYTINITATAGEVEVITSAKGINIITDNKEPLINTISPNPFIDKLDIRLGKHSGQQTNISLWNTLGVAVYKQFLGIGVIGHTINTVDLPGGVYFLIVENDGISKTIKLIK